MPVTPTAQETAQLTDKDIASSLLEDAKTCAKILCDAALEATSDDLHRLFREELERHLQEQREIWSYMRRKGWYEPSKGPLAMAREDLAEARSAVGR
jgi:spore coat protein CotF